MTLSPIAWVLLSLSIALALVWLWYEVRLRALFRVAEQAVAQSYKSISLAQRYGWLAEIRDIEWDFPVYGASFSKRV